MDRTHGAWVIHPRGSDDSERGDRLITASVAGRHDGGRFQPLDRILVTDADGDCGLARRLTQEAKQDDLLLKRLEDGPDP